MPEHCHPAHDITFPHKTFFLKGYLDIILLEKTSIGEDQKLKYDTKKLSTRKIQKLYSCTAEMDFVHENPVTDAGCEHY